MTTCFIRESKPKMTPVKPVSYLYFFFSYMEIFREGANKYLVRKKMQNLVI